MRKLILSFLICLSIDSNAQFESYKWYFGRYTGLDFMTNPPTVLSHTTLNSFEASASIADGSGNLLFYTDGISVWTKDHTIMNNGTGLLGNSSTVQGAVIVKQPGNNNIYFIFTLAMQGHTNGLNYSLVDMSLSAGDGSVTIKNVQITTPCTEQLSATRHCNGIDMWIVTHDLNSNAFKSFLLSSSGLNTTPVISSVGPVPPVFIPNNAIYGQGTIKLSPNGKKLGLTFFNGSNNSEVALFDFDKSSGVVSNYLPLISGSVNYYGCEFSGDGTKFYTTSMQGQASVIQWNLCAGSNSLITASQVTVGIQSSAGQMQLAPDGKIYTVNWGTQSLSIIHNPNTSGVACNHIAVALSVANGSCGAGLPNFYGGAIKILPSITYTLNPLVSCASVSFTAPNIQNPNLGCSAANDAVQNLMWDFGQPQTGPANTSTLNTPTHDFGSPGTYPIKLILNYNCGADTIYENVSIPGPSITVITNSITCNTLGTASVSINGSNGPFTYSWIPTTQTTQSVSGLSAGQYTVNVFEANCSYTSTFQISQAPAISLSIASPTSICSNVSYTLQGFASGGIGAFTYTWSGGPNTSTFVTSQATSGTAVYTLAAIDQSGCSMTNTTQITSLPSPTLTIESVTICPKTTAALTASGANNYIWLPSGSTGNTFTVIPNTTQVFSVTGTASNGCSATSSVSVFVANCTSLDENLKNKLSILIQPNPFVSDLFIETNEKIEIFIFDPTGKEILRQKLEIGRNNIECENLKSGVYLLKTVGTSEPVVKKIIKLD